MKDEEMVKRTIERKLSKLDDKVLKDVFEQDVLMDEFESILFRINHKHEDLVDEAVKIAKDIKILEGWPENKEKFWDLEAANWKFRVPANVKEFISDELDIKGRNLDIGGGSISYVKSVCLDISAEMLEWNDNEEKVQGYAENLPFEKNSFDSVTMIFTANYIDDLKKAVKEIYRVLKKKGRVICIQSGKPVHKMHRLAENKDFDVDKLMYYFKRTGFDVKKENKKVDNTSLVFVEAERL